MAGKGRRKRKSPRKSGGSVTRGLSGPGAALEAFSRQRDDGSAGRQAAIDSNWLDALLLELSALQADTKSALDFLEIGCLLAG